MDAINRYSKLDYAVQPTLFFEFHGSERGVPSRPRRSASIAAEFGGSAFQWATKPEERNKLWQARHDAYYAALALRPGQGLATDVCVPISRLAECILETQQDIAASGLLAPIVGHVGDGNFHLCLPHRSGRRGRDGNAARNSTTAWSARAAMGGTCTGEHGIGTGKMAFLQAEHGEADRAARRILC